MSSPACSRSWTADAVTTAPEEAPPRSERWRAIATRVVGRIGGLPAVRTLVAVLTTYDRAGGGLTAAGLAYAALIALLPGHAARPVDLRA